MNAESQHFFPTTRVSLIVINEKEEILLARHQKKERSYWVLPGGHLEFGETIEQCALRELKEETSLNAKFQRIVFLSESIAPDNSRHIVNLYALLSEVNSSSAVQISQPEDVLVDLAYVQIADLLKLTVYPNISAYIFDYHNRGWPEENIKLLSTPWH